MAVISYEAFLANVQPLHWELLAAFANNQRVAHLATDTAAIDEKRARVGELYMAGVELAWRIVEGKERDQAGDEWVTFEGHLTDVAKGYVVRAARERSEAAQVAP